MKKIIFVFLPIFSFMQNTSCFAQEKLFLKQRKINKHYTVTAADTLDILNGYGNVTINTWDKNEVTIDITENGKAKTAARAQEIVNNINVTEDIAKPRRIYLETHIKTPYNRDNGVKALAYPSNNNYEANVVYIVNAPKNMPMKVFNTMGDVNLGDTYGKLDIKIIHGSFHAKNIYGKDNKILAASDLSRPYISTITSIEKGEVGGTVKLVIDKPIDTTQVSIRGWDTVIVNNVRYKP